MTTNTTYDSSRDLRHTRLILLSTLFFVGLAGCSLVLIWLIRYTRFNKRSARICTLILNLIIANVSVYIFATGIQIYWELQTNRQWPFNDLVCRIVKFFQSFSILSSTYIVVAMAIDRCIAIVTPLKAGQIRVLYLCGGAWVLAGLLSTPNAFLFHLHVNGSVRYCTAVFNHQSTPTLRRIYLTFISLVVYFMPFLVLVFCYALIFVKLLCREHDQQEWSTNKQSSSNCCSSSWKKKMITFTNIMNYKTVRNSSSSRSSFSDYTIRLKRINTYAKARSKTFRMIIVLVLFMILFGAPYYCLELYIAYTGRKPSDLILALAGGAAVAPSSIDPWIFLLFWVNWNEPVNTNSSRRLITLSLQHQQQHIQSRRINRSTTLGASSISDQQNHGSPRHASRSAPCIRKWDVSSQKLENL
ncbi:unnamed protein product [Adineta steineri]|uniref:G-protein coupled receptors family 1 profile domain-containing protein n=2 Tax=Adineta steineri TaxID=433720 RepID=A0A815HWZ8_9BILA|nr:unnamed protein product [Adineta steineri]CAF1167829.1 unnamed protein product [Adineta steineri]CAF1299897.1 unnamed protein product [Adineta steineri]CAF1357426.1 unnamed protein product [Adineta steineri]CAF1423071.1 unnamed protein product [Adineta steineri]